VNSRLFRLFLALGLSLSLFAGTMATGSAVNGPAGPTSIYFPWVPNNTPLGSLGPFYGTVTIQNLESEEVTVYYKATDDGELDDLNEFDDLVLDGRASVTLSAEDLGVPAGGSGVIVRAETVDGEDPAVIAGVQKQAAPVAPAVPVLEATTSAAHHTVGGYTGLTDWDIDDTVVLPIVQTNTGWNTLIRVTNFAQGSEDADVEVTLYPAGGGATWSTDFNLSAGETETIDLLGSGIAPGWVGSAVIESEALVAAVAERHKPVTSMLIMNTSKPTPIAELMDVNGTTQYAPLVFNDYNHWNTGISIANLSSEENDVTITYFDDEGDEVGSDDVTIPANGMNFVYTPAPEENDESGFVGSAIIEGTHPFVGSVDEVKYLGDDDDTGHAMSYMVTADLIGIGESLALPLAQRGVLATGMGDTTGIQLFNPTDHSVIVWIWFVNQNGVQVSLLPLAVAVGSMESHTVYAFDLAALPDDFYGSAIVRVVGGAGGITAASNNVNYAVQFDGSAAFNLVKVGNVSIPVP
jgi:hypothetical protein